MTKAKILRNVAQPNARIRMQAEILAMDKEEREDKILNAQDVIKEFSISYRTLDNWLRKGKIKRHIIPAFPHLRFFKKEEIQRLKGVA